ncbi:gamma-interferon-inducible lysosomal thiol reductase-like [Periophthalmus magnuspinnatus]|uniref:gamma-interferon-inducible lysosomal thiol reductase-like n=1 Tax=Periophthalmus magnuspinnatus TaxID=409849 RepID=UPI00145B43F3|nr:gamma-interferon-inducible lysosomal thiol reductase-like [Periophthalmus magnuspinnatus]XP_055084347.1 gamma-interferon-inducible lysosomal thiol reductase-like [Periophthalmus magnuspinnatus]
MKALLLVIVAVCVKFEPGRGDSPCAHSPHTWCSSAEAAVRCGVLKHCLKANYTKLQQTADPVKVEVYHESLCPDCRGFITQMLYPSSVLLRDIMDLTVVPYGNAQESFDGQKYVFTCQHGEQECLGNMIQSCLLNMTRSNALIIIFCMEAATDVIKAAKSCVELYAPQILWDKVMGCVNGDLGNQIMHQNALKTKALKPPHTFVPWITVNGVHTDDLQDKAMSSLISLVCNEHQGPKPAVCG